MPEQAYERYEGPLGWSAFLTEYRAGLPTDAADDVPDLADDPVGLAHIANPRPAQDAVASPSRSSPPAGPARALRGALESIRRGRGGR